ncbi:MFS transporter [Shimazuella kribbensis]|uniref:MFS transporter n=1 Tax=Shimazuella kribbensis TaxID=139808 RepID=UPI00041FC01D|nr:MFS transporter [Shimazuella kribbensis]
MENHNNKLTTFARRFLGVQFSYRFASSLSKVFISVFLWKLESSLHFIALFFLFQSLSILFFYPLCAWLVRFTSPLFVYRIGIGFYAISYGLILLIQNQAIEVYAVIAIMMGLAESLWSVGTHIVTMDAVGNQLRDRFSHIENLLASFSAVMGPLIAGFVIGMVGGLIGYLTVFTLSFFFFVLAIISSFWVPYISYHGRSNLLSAFTYPLKSWHLFLSATFIWGMVNGLMKTFLITLVIYFLVPSEGWVGFFYMIMSLMTVVASFYYAKQINPKNRNFYYLFACIGLLITSSMLYWETTIFILVVYIVVLGLLSPALDIPMETVMYEVIDQATSKADRRLDFIVVREIPFGIGRMAGLLLFLWGENSFQSKEFLFGSLVAVSILYLICVFLMNKGSASESN